MKTTQNMKVMNTVILRIVIVMYNLKSMMSTMGLAGEASHGNGILVEEVIKVLGDQEHQHNKISRIQEVIRGLMTIQIIRIMEANLILSL